jgi:hypothetical protein
MKCLLSSFKLLFQTRELREVFVLSYQVVAPLEGNRLQEKPSLFRVMKETVERGSELDGVDGRHAEYYRVTA